jgi:hypothetical protein
MNGEIQDGPETSSRGVGWGWVFWPGVLLLLYVLSTGPVWVVYDKWLFRHPGSPLVWRFLGFVYLPVRWAYQVTPLHKPLGVYWHLWVPEWYDSKGDWRY